MTTYEILTIASEADEKAQKDLSQKIQGLVKKENGKPISQESLGTKKLATPIKKQEIGTYLSVVAELKPESIKTIKKQLTATGNIMTVFIFKSPEITKEKPKIKKVTKVKKVSKADKADKVEKIKKVKKTKAVQPKPKKKPVKPEVKSEITTEIEGEENRLKKLDEKLDEILKE